MIYFKHKDGLFKSIYTEEEDYYCGWDGKKLYCYHKDGIINEIGFWWTDDRVNINLREGIWVEIFPHRA